MRRTTALIYAIATVTGIIAASVLASTASAEGTSYISGVAFEDTDGDGVQDPGEPGFSGHSIYLLNAEQTTFIAATVTDEVGHYAFTALEDGTYNVQYNSSTWTPLHNDWFPTTSTVAVIPSLDVTVSDSATANWGFRRIVRSTDVNAPISDYVGPSGLHVQSYVDVVPARTIHDALATGLLGAEARYITVRFGLSSNSTTSTSSVNSDGRYISYAALAWVAYESWAASGGGWTTLAHEYGHAWSHYHLAMTQQTDSWADYVAARGLQADSRVGSSYAWAPDEMIAEDYRQLLGPPLARTAPRMNQSIPAAADVPGLLDYLRQTFVTGPDAPLADTTAPIAVLASPGSDSTLSGTISVIATATDDQAPPADLQMVVILDGTTRIAASFDPADAQFRALIDSLTLSNGSHTIAVEATDPSGNHAMSAVVTTTVQNISSKKKTGAASGRPRR